MLSATAFLTLALQCAPNIHADTLQALVRTESGFNPYAIGVVGTPLAKQPTNLNEALDAITALNNAGLKYSLGLSQIYIGNLANEKDISTVFEPCKNLKLGANILTTCYKRALPESNDDQEALKKAFSCYYSNNFSRGFKKEKDGFSYVDRIVKNADKNTDSVTVPAILTQQSNKESSSNKNDESEIETDSNQSQDTQTTQTSQPKKHWDIYSDFKS